LADQVSLADAGEMGFQSRDPAFLGSSTRDPEYVGETLQRARRGVRVGRLGIVDKEYRAFAANLLHPMMQSGKTAHREFNLIRRNTESTRSGIGAGRVLRIVPPAQTADARQ